MVLTLYMSKKCANCARMMNTIRRIPSLQDTRIIDVEFSPAPGIEYVPTLVDQRGKHHVGGKAFEYLRQFDGEITLEPMQLGTGSLAYGSIENGNELNFIQGYFEL